MSPDEIVRAWRDYDFWRSLSTTEQAKVPESPAGAVELMDAEMELIAGGSDTKDTCGACVTRWTPTPCCY